MVRAEVEIVNKAGLHARAASKLARLTASFASSVQIGQDKMVDGKSILALMMLAAVKGARLNIVIEGPDEQEALKKVVALINNRFDEAE